jgi:hypothetical protein
VLIGRQQSVITGQVDSVRQSVQNFGRDFLKQIDDDKRWERDLIKAIYQSHEQDRTPESLARSSSNLLSEVDRDKANRFPEMILAGLRYGGMTDRDERIVEAHRDTCEWIYQESRGDSRTWTNFTKWLECNSGLYWITGKAGGKLKC